MPHHIAKSGKYAFSPDYQHNDVPDYNGGDGLFAGGYSPIDGGASLLRAKNDKPQPLFSQASLYGLGLSRIAPFGPGTSYAAGDFFDTRWNPRFGYAVAATLSRPCRTLIVRRSPPSVDAEDFYAAINAGIDDLYELKVTVQGTAFSPAGAAGFDGASPPLAALLPKLLVDTRDDGNGLLFPLFDYPDPKLFRGGETLIVDYWSSALGPATPFGAGPNIFRNLNATITDGGGETSDGISTYSYTVTIRLPADPVGGHEQYVYLVGFSDVIDDGRAYANEMAKRFARYKHVVFRPPPTEDEAPPEGEVVADLIDGYDFAEDAGSAAGDAASAVADLVERARAFFSAD